MNVTSNKRLLALDVMRGITIAGIKTIATVPIISPLIIL